MRFGRRALDFASRRLGAAFGIDIALYRELYPDLSAKPSWRLLDHYVRTGRAEGRTPSLRAALEAQRRGEGPLPKAFSPEAYALLNPDVAEAWQDAPGLILHYLLHGRHEQRRYALFDHDFYRALYELDDDATDAALERDYERRAQAGTAHRNWSELTRAHGMRPGPWLELFDPYDFSLLSPDWSGPPGPKPRAVAAFLEHGLERLTPIRLDLAFEPDYQAEANPGLATLAPTEAYRHWLLSGLPRGEAGSGQARLASLGLDLAVFPEAFDWTSHLRRRGLATGSRWDALHDLVHHGHASGGPDLVDGVAPESFVLALCDAVGRLGDFRSALAFADHVSTQSRRLTTLRAHALYALERWADACALYRTILAGEVDEQVWSRAALASARSGDLRDAVQILELGAPILSSSPVWRAAAKEVLDLAFHAEDAEGGPPVLSEGVAQLLYPPLPLPLTASTPRVVVDAMTPEISIDAILTAGDVAIAGTGKSPARLQIEAAARALAGPPNKSPRQSAPQRPRVLVVNTFFPPDDIGGATAVLRENIRDWRASAALDDFDVAVACADLASAGIGLVRPDSSMGLSVFRIGVADDPLADQRHGDAVVQAAFTRVLQALQPDLVHFHSVQRLTGSVIDACIAAGIPYFVTLHDGWWLSDRQFFVDANGMLTESREQAALLRLRDNLERLNKAQRVLAVSDWVAQAYAQAGVRNVETLSNGLSERAPVPRRLRSNGALRLGHLGGVARIKGYHLLEAVLKRGAFSGLEVTVVDHRRPEGYERHEIWGVTPVRVIGALKPHRVQEFYADLDILVAPSVAPETYGLAVREALVAGLWVVASDRGAAAQAVTPGENGFVIDVSEAAPLIHVLKDLDKRPDAYRKPPTRRPEVQSSAVQAHALHALYLTEVRAASHGAEPGPAALASPSGG